MPCKLVMVLCRTAPKRGAEESVCFALNPGKCENVGTHMMTSSNGNIFRETGPLCGNSPVTGEFPAQRPVTRSLDVFFDLHLNKRLSKQWWGWWFETPSCPLLRHCNDLPPDSAVAIFLVFATAYKVPPATRYPSCRNPSASSLTKNV